MTDVNQAIEDANKAGQTDQAATKDKVAKAKMNLKIEHQVPGRVRLKLPAGKGNAALLKQVSEVFAVIPGIEEIVTNPATGSVVLRYKADQHDEFHKSLKPHYEPAAKRPAVPGFHGAHTELDNLTEQIEAEAEYLAAHSNTARAVVSFVKKLDHEIKSATGNNIDLQIIFAAGIIALTVFEAGPTAATPVWVTLAIFSLNHFIEMHKQQLAAADSNLAPIRVKAGRKKAGGAS